MSSYFFAQKRLFSFFYLCYNEFVRKVCCMKNLKKIINKFTKNRKVLIIAGVLLAVIILVTVFVLIFGGSKKNQSQVLSESLKDLGADFYETFYYKQVGTTDEERKEFLEKYKDLGLKISLDSLARHNKEKTDEIIAEFVNNETGEECDRTNSMVVIYPRDPYGKSDYSIDAILVCGFEVTETK